MANFPTSLDTNPSAATLAAENLDTTPHSTLHGDLGDQIEALEAKVGVNSSAVTSSHDYKIAQVEAHVTDTSAAHAATAISADSTTLVGTGTDVQAVLEELDNGIADHLADTSAAHAASAVSADSTTLVGVGTDVQAVLEELDNGIADHLADTAGAHAASAISFSPTGTIAATDVQAAIAEVASEAGGGGSVATDTIFDAKGDLAVGTAADTAAKLTVGANDRLLIADSAQATGLRWATAAEVRTAIDVPTTGEAILDSLLTTRGDLIRRGAASPERVALGADGTFLMSDGTDAVWGRPPYIYMLDSGTNTTASSTTLQTVLTATQDIAANELVVGDVFQVKAWGTMIQTSGAGATLRLVFELEGQHGIDWTSSSLTSNANRRLWTLDAWIVVRTLGGFGASLIAVAGNASVSGPVAGYPAYDGLNATGTYGLGYLNIQPATTSAITIDLQATTSVNHASAFVACAGFAVIKYPKWS